ncbi:MAG: peptidylprolyl isomerase [Kiritimatiellae bacterium]|nr:peptidylprolyl isomerase [Kiritimatiellia bacterium]
MSIRINGEIIPEEAILFELSRLVQFYSQHMSEAEVRSQMDILKQRAKDQAIGAKLLIDEADKLDLRIPKDDIDTRFNEMMQQAGGEDAFMAVLKTNNLTKEKVKEDIERGRRVDLLVDKVTEGLSDPTEEEMADHFKQHSDEYRKPDRANAQHILIKPEDDSAEDQETAKSQLTDIRKQIEEGADFSDMATMHSSCPSGKSTGGSLGWFSKGMMVPEFDKAVFTMKVGDLSDVIETSMGYHIVKKLEEEIGGPADYNEVRDNVKNFLRHTQKGVCLSAHVNELKEKVTITED